MNCVVEPTGVITHTMQPHHNELQLQFLWNLCSSQNFIKEDFHFSVYQEILWWCLYLQTSILCCYSIFNFKNIFCKNYVLDEMLPLEIFVSIFNKKSHTAQPIGVNTMLPHFSELWSYIPWKLWSKFYHGPLCFHVQSRNQVAVWVQTLYYVKLYSKK
jgi:hypothetical protein